MEGLKPWTQLKLTKPVQKQQKTPANLVYSNPCLKAQCDFCERKLSSFRVFFFFLGGGAGFWTAELQIRSLGINQGDETSMQQIRKTIRRWWTRKAFTEAWQQQKFIIWFTKASKPNSPFIFTTNTTLCRIAATLQVPITFRCNTDQTNINSTYHWWDTNVHADHH